MKFSILVILSLAAVVYADCNNSGIKGSYANIEQFLGTVCNGLSGSYVQNEQRHQCVMDNSSPQIQWDFTLKYIGSDKTRTIGAAECIKGMTKEAKCSKGGKSDYQNWSYNADPNAGSCYSISK